MDKYAVFGNPISHSKSPRIHQHFAEQVGHQISYETIEAPVDNFHASVAAFIRQGAKGANVTVPFKLEAFELADSLSERAQLAGAVNTLTFSDGVIVADNTDGQGLVDDLIRLSGALIGKRILLIGAGGAARGVIAPLLAEKVAAIYICNRTHAKAIELAGRFAHLGDVKSCEEAELAQQDYDIVINSTSSSLENTTPDLPPTIFNNVQLAYDMFYSQQHTSFMLWAKTHNAKVQVSDGLGMLVGQAAESFYLWRGVKPDIAETLAYLKAQA